MNIFELSKSQKGEKYTETSLHGFSSQALVAQLEGGFPSGVQAQAASQDSHQRALAGSGRGGRLGDVKSGSHQRASRAVQADQAVQKK